MKVEDLTHLFDAFGDQVYDAFDPFSNTLSLQGYGYRWLSKNTIQKR